MYVKYQFTICKYNAPTGAITKEGLKYFLMNGTPQQKISAMRILNSNKTNIKYTLGYYDKVSKAGFLYDWAIKHPHLKEHMKEITILQKVQCMNCHQKVDDEYENDIYSYNIGKNQRLIPTFCSQKCASEWMAA